MDEEPVNCWFTNSHPFTMGCYSEGDKNSKHIDALLMLWSGILERLATLCNDKNLSKEMIQTANTLSCSVAYYQAANVTHESNPVAGFASFRDSLKHLIKGALSWNMDEEDEFPPPRADLINQLTTSAKAHFSSNGVDINERMLELANKQALNMIDYDTTTSWPYSIYAVSNSSGMKESHQIALQDLDDIPEISTFGQVIRGPLAIGILVNCKKYWLDDLDEESQLHLLVAKAQLFTEYAEEIEPGVLNSIQDEEWPDWAISLLPIVPDI